MKYFLSVVALSALIVNAAPSNVEKRASACTITTYTQSGSMSSCSSISISGQTIPGGESLSLTNIPSGITVTLDGDLTFGTGTFWTGTLFTVSGGTFTFDGQGYTINGNGQYYWDGEGTNGGNDKPKYTVSVQHSGTFQNVKVINVPGHAFQVANKAALTITGVVYDNSAGASLGANTDGFDISGVTDLTITGNTVINQDDCVAINDGTNIVISNNSCTGSHGISIGSVKTGDTVSGVTITGNTVINSQNGLRIKTYSGATSASVSNVTYANNKVTGCTDYGVIIVQDYTNSGETGTATSGVPIKDVSFTTGNTVEVNSGATMVKVLCGSGDCTGNWNWAGLTTSGSTKADVNEGGAPITNFNFGTGGSSPTTTSKASSTTKVTSSTSSTTKKTSATSNASPTSTKGTSTATSSASGATQSAYGQCGGEGWTGPVLCSSGYTCTYSNPYYSQCTAS